MYYNVNRYAGKMYLFFVCSSKDLLFQKLVLSKTEAMLLKKKYSWLVKENCRFIVVL